MTTELDAAVARLKRDLEAIAAETSGAKEARGDVRLLLADWERLRQLDQPGLPEAMQKVRAVKVLTEERDAARAEVERLQGLLTVTDAALVRTGEQARKAEAEAKFGAGLAQDLSGELARLRERDAQVRAVLGNPGIDRQTAINRALALLKETP